MVGSIRLPSIAVVAMVEPEIAENTVPATMVMTESRPGTRRMSSAIASMAFIATPVWNSTSPIRTKNGIGVSEKLVTDCTALRAELRKPRLAAEEGQSAGDIDRKKGEGDGKAKRHRATRPPNSSRLASIQSKRASADDVARTRRVRRPSPVRRCSRNTNSSRKQQEDHRQRREQPPFGKHEVLDGDRAEPQAVIGHDAP